MLWTKPYLKILGVPSEFNVMYLESLFFAGVTALLGAYQAFGYAATVFFSLVAAEYVIGWLAHHRRGDWSRKKAMEGLVTIIVMVILLMTSQAVCLAANVSQPYPTWLALFWAASVIPGLHRNSVYLGVKPIPGLSEMHALITLKLSRLLVPLEQLRAEDIRDRRETAERARAISGVVSVDVPPERSQAPAGQGS